MSQMYKECDDIIAKYASKIESLTEENARLKAEVINKAHEYAELSGENDSLKAALHLLIAELESVLEWKEDGTWVIDCDCDGLVVAKEEAKAVMQEDK